MLLGHVSKIRQDIGFGAFSRSAMAGAAVLGCHGGLRRRILEVGVLIIAKKVLGFEV